MRQTAREDDPVHPAVSGGGKPADGAGAAVQHTVIDQLGMGVALADAPLDLLRAGRAQMRHQPAPTADHVHDLLLRVLAGKAHRHERAQADAAHALRREHPLIVAHTVHHLAADEQSSGVSAAQMQHDEAAVLQRLVQDILSAAHRHGTAVERMSRHHARQLRRAGDTRLIGHLVHGNGVADKGGQSQRLRKTQCQHTAEVGGVGGVADGVHKVHHLLIHRVGSRRAVRHLTAAGAYRVQTGHIDMVRRKLALDGGLTVICLLHDPCKGFQLLHAVSDGGVEFLFLSAEQSQLGGGRAGIDN